MESQDFHDWTMSMSQYYRKFDGIKKYCMFWFEKEQKSMVLAKNVPLDKWTKINIIKKASGQSHQTKSHTSKRNEC